MSQQTPAEYPPVLDGIVSLDHEHGRYRLEVRHSETDADYLWLSPVEAIDATGLLNAAVKPLFEGKPAYQYAVEEMRP